MIVVRIEHEWVSSNCIRQADTVLGRVGFSAENEEHRLVIYRDDAESTEKVLSRVAAMRRHAQECATLERRERENERTLADLIRGSAMQGETVQVD